MKRLAISLTLIIGVAFLSLPVKAQDDKMKDKKKEAEQIIITLKGDKNDKVIIEIDGDNVKVNGKNADDLKDSDVKVLRNKFKTMEGLNIMTAPRVGRGGTMNFNWDDQNGLMRFYSTEDDNRALLGVVTEKSDNGVKVTDVTDESAAEKAGIKEGDIIKKIDETKIEDPDGLTEAIRKHKPGDKVSVTVLRDKKEQKLSAELGKWKGAGAITLAPGQNFNLRSPEFDFKEFNIPKVPATPGHPFGQTWSGGSPRLGISVQDTEDGKGVKVIEVDDESNAAKAGVKENDIITHFNDKEVNSADEVAKLVRESKDKPSIRLQVKRNGKTQNIEVKIPRKLKTADL